MDCRTGVLRRARDNDLPSLAALPSNVFFACSIAFFASRRVRRAGDCNKPTATAWLVYSSGERCLKAAEDPPTRKRLLTFSFFFLHILSFSSTKYRCCTVLKTVHFDLDCTFPNIDHTFFSYFNAHTAIFFAPSHSVFLSLMIDFPPP